MRRAQSTSGVECLRCSVQANRPGVLNGHLSAAIGAEEGSAVLQKKIAHDAHHIILLNNIVAKIARSVHHD